MTTNPRTPHPPTGQRFNVFFRLPLGARKSLLQENRCLKDFTGASRQKCPQNLKEKCPMTLKSPLQVRPNKLDGVGPVDNKPSTD